MYKFRKKIFLGIKWSPIWLLFFAFVAFANLSANDYKFTILDENKKLDIGIKSVFNEEQAKIDFQTEGKLNLDSNDDGIVRIYDIDTTLIEKDDARFYLVETDDNYIALEAEEDDPEITQLLARKDTLKNNPKYIKLEIQNETESRGGGRYSRRRTVTVIPEYLKLDFQSEFEYLFSDKSLINNKQLVTNKYLSIKEARSSIVSGVVFSLVFLLIAIIIFAVIIYKIKDNIKRYSKLEKDLPEIVGDYKIISDNAKYSSKYLKIIIYNNILIFAFKKLDHFVMDDIKTINIRKVKNKHRTYYNLYVSLVNKEQYNITYKNSSKTKDDLKEFYTYIKENYSNIDITKN